MAEVTPVNTQRNFLAGGGEMGALIRAYDWGSSILGEPEQWPQSLKTTVRLLLSTGHPMFIWWGTDLIQFYNDAYRRSIGPERHPSALGQNGRECWAEIWPVIGPQVTQVLAGEGHTWNENQLIPITRNGRREDVYWTYSYGPIDDPNAETGVGGVLVVCTETTKQVLAERRTLAAEARWRALFDQAPGFMCILQGPQHRYEYANPPYYKMVGMRDLLGKSVAEALPEVVEQGFIDLLDEVYLTGKPYQGLATPLNVNSVDSIYVDFVYQPIVDEQGQVTGILVDGYDVTERVKAAESLREEDRRKDEFLAMLAHELRNPLAPIRNASELLTQSAQHDPKLQSIGNVLARHVTQLTRLMDDLLDISRITQDRITLQLEPLNLSHCVNFALESLQGAIHAKQHKVHFLDWQQPLFINGDMTRVVQCLSNVLNNAIKYTDPAGQIEIELSALEQWAVITVTDNGCGISQDMLEKVFGLFVQAHRTLDRSQGGLGIGLSIVQRMLQMHGGDIQVTSAGLGHGSCFRLRLPLIDAPHLSDVKNSEVKSARKRVLLVDDNVDAVDTLAELLELQGHDVKTVYTAKQALNDLDDFAPHFILLDIGLPDIDGYEVARRIRKKNSESILVALTGYGQADDVRRAKGAGFDFHFTKPVDLTELLSMFNSL